jgi:hypothetical protein
MKNITFYYGQLSSSILQWASQYDLIVLHPSWHNIHRNQIAFLQSHNTLVLAYVSIGEDLQSVRYRNTDMLASSRFVGDGSGVCVDGQLSYGGYASYYVQIDSAHSEPARNPESNAAIVNTGDPNWFEVINSSTFDSHDGVCGLQEILSLDYGRGLGCDGVMLDGFDMAAPDEWATPQNRRQYSWTAAGYTRFLKQLRTHFPDVLVMQNQGLFFFDPRFPQSEFCTAECIDYLLIENLQSHHSFDTQDLMVNYLPHIKKYDLQLCTLSYSEDDLHKICQQTLPIAKEIGAYHYVTNRHLTRWNDVVRMSLL